MRTPLLFLLCTSFAACKPPATTDGQAEATQHAQHSTSVASVPVASESSKPKFTAEQWKSAVNRTFDRVSAKRLRDKKNPAYVEDPGETDKDGVTNFFACFDKSPPKCDFPTSAKRDSFRKIQFFSDPSLEWSNLTAEYERRPKHSLRAYISLKDCGAPRLFVRPTYRGSEWLFFEEFGIMADGVLVVDRKLSNDQISRENTHAEVSESVHIALTESEITSLRSLPHAKQVLIRLSVQKGYVGVDVAQIKSFVEGAGRLLHVYDSIQTALADIVNVKDPACPE